MPNKILVVDDLSLGRIVLRAKLSAACYDSLLAVSGGAAIELARKFRPDLVLMDCCLPDISGPEVCQILRNDPTTAQIPIVLYTASCDRETRLRGLAAGADDVLRKPLDEAYLLSRVRALLRKSSAEQEYRAQGRASLSLELAQQKSATSINTHIALVCNDGAPAPVPEGLSETMFDRVLALPEALNPTRPELLPDVLLLAPEVIHLHGVSIISDLRSRALTRDIPIVALMPECMRAERSMALDLGAEEVLKAPFDTTEIEFRLASVVKRKVWADAMRRALSAELDLATRDPLTGLFNRRHGLLHMARLMDMTKTSGEAGFAVLLIDIDNFKTVNDSYGHLAGDKVLIDVAHRMETLLRPTDMLARYGGEEFLLIVPNVTIDMATELAERIRRGIEANNFDVRGGAEPLRITVSIGVSMDGPARLAGALDKTQHMERLIDQADQALHVAKTSGRNKVSVSPAAAASPRALASGAVSATPLPAHLHSEAVPRVSSL